MACVVTGQKFAQKKLAPKSNFQPFWAHFPHGVLIENIQTAEILLACFPETPMGNLWQAGDLATSGCQEASI